jgi:hypothetical protein
MSGAFERQAANVTLPTVTYSDAFGATAANTGGFDMGVPATGAATLVGNFVWIKASEECSIRASSVAITTAAGNIATVGDMKLEADTDYSFRINEATRYVSVFGGATAGTLFIAKADGE